MMKENRATYDCFFKFPEGENVLWLARLQIDTKVVPMKLPMENPYTGKVVECCFAGASTRRQGLYKYVAKTKAGEVLGG